MRWNSKLYDNSHDFVSKFGQDILSYLNPRAGETILDVGCGTGDLAKQISSVGAEVVGIDSSADMISTAKSKYPDIEFYHMDVRQMHFDIQFDAIFSNAVLHWVPEKEIVIKNMHSLLKDNGRIVIEFGGKGNNQQMLKALRDCFKSRGLHKNAAIDFWYYPSIGEYATELEKQNFRVIHAEHFDRITPLKSVQGIKDWFRMFGDYFFVGVPDIQKEEILDEVQNSLRDTHLVDGIWNADYKRIRVVAIKNKVE
jgi:trans-aconitate methyltransferase